jgi:hypothetical protein
MVKINDESLTEIDPSYLFSIVLYVFIFLTYSLLGALLLYRFKCSGLDKSAIATIVIYSIIFLAKALNLILFYA